MGAEEDTLIRTTLRWCPLPVPLETGINHLIAPKAVFVDEENSYPCRKCLTDGKIGEQMLLLSYDPWLGDSPYRQPGPIYIHEKPKCELAEFGSGLPAVVPEQQRRRLLSVRAFDNNHIMKGGDVFRGTDLMQKAEEYFNNHEVEYIHVHNAIPGCFAVRIDRGKCL